MKRFSVVVVNLDPTVGAEIKKTRPCVIISPDVVNDNLKTLIVAPLTTHGFNYPTRIKVKFNGLDGLIVLDQIRTIDKQRVVKIQGVLDIKFQKELLTKLAELFA